MNDPILTTEQSNAELIAEVTDRFTWPTQTSDKPLLDRLAAALEAAEQRAENAERQRAKFEAHNVMLLRNGRQVLDQRDQYAAVVEKVRGLIHGPSGLTINEEKVWQLVNSLTAPEDALRELKADVWDEGEEAGMKNQENWDGWQDTKPPITNPYREEQD